MTGDNHRVAIESKFKRSRKDNHFRVSSATNPEIESLAPSPIKKLKKALTGDKETLGELPLITPHKQPDNNRFREFSLSSSSSEDETRSIVGKYLQFHIRFFLIIKFRSHLPPVNRGNSFFF